MILTPVFWRLHVGSLLRVALTLLMLTVLPGSLRAEAAPAAVGIGGDFTLTDQHGQPFRLSEQRGKVVLLFFGFTHCPVICPDTLGKLIQTLRLLEDRADKVSVVFVSVDPERDTVAHLAQYLPFYSERITGLTGTPQQVRAVADQYHARFTLNKASPTDTDYSVDHTADIYVIDRDGQLDSLIPYGMPAEHILRVTQQTLNKPWPVSAQHEAEQPDEADRADPADQRLRALDGSERTLTEWRGQPLLVNVWATWCPPCRQELPSLNRAQKILQTQPVRLLALNVGETPQAVTAFLHDYPIDFPVWLDESGAALERWNIQGMPTTLLLDADGREIWRAAGERAWDSEDVLGEILAALEKVER